MKLILATLCLSATIIQAVHAQNLPSTPELKRRPAQVSLLPLMGTNGNESVDYYQPISFNVIGGYNGGSSGFELGGIFNKDEYFMKGIQIAGMTNTVGGYVSGLQLAGISNTGKGETNGIQLAGILNTSTHSYQLVQVAGILNRSNDGNHNHQFAGIANQVKGNLLGIQAAGLVNLVQDSLRGTQISAVFNRTGEMKGVQVGLVNSAKHIQGLQIGLINKADSATATLGLINIVRKNGYYRWEIWVSESFYANAAFKMGTKRLYSILAAGWREKNNSYQLGYGLGLGTELYSRVSTALSLDLIHYQLSENKLFSKGMNNLLQSQITWSEGFNGRNAIFIGLTFNFLYSEKHSLHNKNMDISPWYLYERINENARFAIWPGLNLGIRF